MTNPVRNFSGGKYDADLDEKYATEGISNRANDKSSSNGKVSNLAF